MVGVFALDSAKYFVGASIKLCIANAAFSDGFIVECVHVKLFLLVKVIYEDTEINHLVPTFWAENLGLKVG